MLIFQQVQQQESVFPLVTCSSRGNPCESRVQRIHPVHTRRGRREGETAQKQVCSFVKLFCVMSCVVRHFAIV